MTQLHGANVSARTVRPGGSRQPSATPTENREPPVPVPAAGKGAPFDDEIPYARRLTD